MKNLIASVVMVLLYSINSANSAKILAVFAFPAHSHFTLGSSLVKGLAKRGHDIVFINAFPQQKPIPNVREISVSDIIVRYSKLKNGLYEMGEMAYLGQLQVIGEFGFEFVHDILNYENIQQLLNSNEKFDLVLMEHFVSEAMAIIPYKFNCPYVLVTPGPTSFFNNYLFANHAPTSYIPNLLSTFRSNMNLWERIVNTYYDVAGELYNRLYVIPNQNEILQKAVPGAPNLKYILYRASLMLTTSHPSINEPVPLQQNIKEVGGYHVSDPNPLPKDLQQFLDDAKEGVILFSMGSNLKSADFPEKKKHAVLGALSRIKQKVLWKFEKDLLEKPANVKIVEWLPQNDVLAHPNVVAFISHGGLLGNIEAIHHGVPILGLPVFWDQEPNIEAAVNKGYAVRLNFRDITEESFEYALTEILNNPKYTRNAKKQQKILHDRIIKPLDEAIYWIEYVIRHNGAEHLKSAGLDLSWFQRYLIDVALILFILMLITFTVIKKLFSSNKNKETTTPKNKRSKKEN